MPPPTRSTRQSSRTSSPFAIATRNSPAPPVKEPVKERKQSSLQEWVEPLPPAPQPSFMDHHFDRTSIFQDMQPLGAMPSSKLKQRIRESHARRATAGAGDALGAVAVDEERGSLEATPALDVPTSEARKWEDTTPQPAAQQDTTRLRVQEKAQSETKKPERVQRLKITNINGTTPSASLPNTPTRPPPSASHSRQTSYSTVPSWSDDPSPHNSPLPKKKLLLKMPFTHAWNRETADATLAAATRRAEEVGGKSSQISKLALMEVFRMADVDQRLHAAIAALGSGTATHQQERRYKNYIKRSKIRLRRELEKGELRFSNISTPAGPADNVAGSSLSPRKARLSSTPGSANPATNISSQPEDTRRASGLRVSNKAAMSPIKALAPAISLDPSPEGGSAPTSSQPTTPMVTEQSPAAQGLTNGVVTRSESAESPSKQKSEQSSDGNLSEVDETLIRKVEDEQHMETLPDAPSEDDESKRPRRAKDKRNGKAQQARGRNTRRRGQEGERITAEEEQRQDDERVAYKQRYLEEGVPALPHSYKESNIRSLPTPPVNSPPKPTDDPPAASTRSQRRQQQQQASQQNTLAKSPLQLNGAQKRTIDEVDDDSASSLTEDLGSSAFDSDAEAPLLPPPSKRQKTAAKTKISPVKNRNGAVAGVSRLGGGRGTPLANDDTEKTSDDEHQDTCTACGGEGLLLCCDGCDAAYHFQCCDPPLSEESKELQTAWFCPKCRRTPRKERETSPRVPDSVWGEMSNVVRNLPGKNFQLPKSIQTYFEDNSVGPEGDYVTGQVSYTRVSHARDGPEEHPDYYRLVDKKEKPILCSYCFQGVGYENSKRPIVQCDKPSCLAYWHLDCLDPPLANPPVRGWQKGYQKTRLQWLCPRHAEHDYRDLHHPAFRAAPDQFVAGPVLGGTAHRMRVPRKPNYIDFHRGMRTSGRIDVVNRDDEDETSHRFFEEEDMDGNVVRMPEDDIKLNFIAKVKADRMYAESQGRPNAKRRKLSHLDTAFQRRSFNDQRAALSLAQLAERQNEVDVNADGVAQLVYALTAQAEGDFDDGNQAPSFDIDPSDRKQRAELLKIRRLIDMALATGPRRADGAVHVPNGVNLEVPIAPNPRHPMRIPRTLAPHAPSVQDGFLAKRQHLDIPTGDAIEVRSEGGFEPFAHINGTADDREAQSAPNSRPNSRRETRRTSRRSAVNLK